MRTVELGKSGVSTSGLGLGALHFGAFLDEDESTKVIDRAIDAGVSFLDTGRLYGNGISERIVGNAVRAKRHSVQISTKVGVKAVPKPDGSFGAEVEQLTPVSIRRWVDASLTELGTDYIDLLSMHAYDESTPIADTLGELERVREEGKVLAIGVSNYSPEQLESAVAASRAMSKPGLDACQAHYNMIERRVGNSLLLICSENQINFVCNRAVARGILTGKYISGREFPPESRAAQSDRVRRWATSSTINLVEGLNTIAEGIGTSVTAMALAWLAQMQGVGIVLVGTRDIAQLDECLEAADLVLSPETFDAIEALINSYGMSEQVNLLPEVYFER